MERQLTTVTTLKLHVSKVCIITAFNKWMIITCIHEGKYTTPYDIL